MSGSVSVRLGFCISASAFLQLCLSLCSVQLSLAFVGSTTAADVQSIQRTVGGEKGDERDDRTVTGTEQHRDRETQTDQTGSD